jgi:hypothetical protein
MSNSPTLWSSIGFWILIFGLIGDIAVLFISSGKLEKTLAAIFTIIVIIGVTIEHIADAKRFGHRSLNHKQQMSITATLKPLARIPDPRDVAERVTIAVFPATAEGTELAHQIEATLKAAEWAPEKPQTGESLGVTVLGVAVFTTPESNKASRCADALAKALNSSGILTVIGGNIPGIKSCRELASFVGDHTKTDPWCARILVLVGDHP